MKFYCINKKNAAGKARAYLQAACESLEVDFFEIVSENFDAVDFPKLGVGDMLYRISTDKVSLAVEQYLINGKVATFYDNSYQNGRISRASYLMLRNSGVPTPETIPVPSLNKGVIEKYVRYLGGFPVVIKVVGGSRGTGVIRVDSMAALYSITDYLDAIESKYVLRQFINVNDSGRLIVLGDEVIASVQYRASGHDFRSNSRLSATKVFEKKYPQDVQKYAIIATKSMGLEFGGVDVLIDEDGQPYILEINFPFGFPEAQKVTGIDIAKKMVAHLKEKSIKLLKTERETL